MVHCYSDIISGRCDRTQKCETHQGKAGRAVSITATEKKNKKPKANQFAFSEREMVSVVAEGRAHTQMGNVCPVLSHQFGQARAPVQQRTTLRFCLKSIPKTPAGCLKLFSQVTSFSWSTECFKVYFEEAALASSPLKQPWINQSLNWIADTETKG